MNSKIYLDFNQIKQDVKILSDKIINSYTKYDAIIAISGGGLLPARLLRNYLNIPIYCINVKFYNNNNTINKKPQIIQWLGKNEARNLVNKNVLVIDDLNDTGSTLHFVMNLLTNGYIQYNTLIIKPIKCKHFAIGVLYDKCKPKSYILSSKFLYFKTRDIEDKWVVFPWEE